MQKEQAFDTGEIPAAGADRVLACARRISHLVDVRSRFLIARHGLSLPQLVVLRQLNEAEKPLAICDLVLRVHLSQATLTGIVDRLERQGIVRRTRSGSDRRRFLIELTERGENILARMPSLLHRRFFTEFEGLSQTEQERLLAALQKVVRMLESSARESAEEAVVAEVERSEMADL